MNKQCTGCVVSAGTHKPAEALHQIDEPQADAMRGNTAGGVRCHDADACAMGQFPCPTPVACGCASAPLAVQAAEPVVLGWVRRGKSGLIGNHFYTYEPHCDAAVRDDGGEKIAVIAALAAQAKQGGAA